MQHDSYCLSAQVNKHSQNIWDIQEMHKEEKARRNHLRATGM